MVAVIPWSEQLRPQVLTQLGEPTHWTLTQGRAIWREDTDGEFWSRTVVLMDDGHVLGVASAFHPRLHPSYEWLYLEVAPRHRRQGWGTRTLDALRTLLPSRALPLRAKVSGGSAALTMALGAGMSVIQRTRQILFHPSPTDSTVSAKTVAPDESAVIEAWRRWYVEGHQWDPPATLPQQFWADMSADTEHVVVVEGKSGLLGIAHRFRENGQPWFVGGALDRSARDADDIAAALLVCAAQDAAFTVELDDWMTDTCRVVERSEHRVLDESFIVAERPAATTSITTQ